MADDPKKPSVWDRIGIEQSTAITPGSPGERRVSELDIAGVFREVAARHEQKAAESEADHQHQQAVLLAWRRHRQRRQSQLLRSVTVAVGLGVLAGALVGTLVAACQNHAEAAP